MVSELNKLLRGLWFDNAIVSPKGFFHYLQVLSIKLGGGQFVGNNQNDSSELLIFILDTIHEGLCKPIATPFLEQDISKINEPYYAENDKLYAWACHLAYGQFHTTELKNGQAMEMLLNG